MQENTFCDHLVKGYKNDCDIIDKVHSCKYTNFVGECSLYVKEPLGRNGVCGSIYDSVCENEYNNEMYPNSNLINRSISFGECHCVPSRITYPIYLIRTKVLKCICTEQELSDKFKGVSCDTRIACLKRCVLELSDTNSYYPFRCYANKYIDFINLLHTKLRKGVRVRRDVNEISINGKRTITMNDIHPSNHHNTISTTTTTTRVHDHKNSIYDSLTNPVRIGLNQANTISQTVDSIKSLNPTLSINGSVPIPNSTVVVDRSNFIKKVLRNASKSLAHIKKPPLGFSNPSLDKNSNRVVSTDISKSPKQTTTDLERKTKRSVSNTIESSTTHLPLKSEKSVTGSTGLSKNQNIFILRRINQYIPIAIHEIVLTPTVQRINLSTQPINSEVESISISQKNNHSTKRTRIVPSVQSNTSISSLELINDVLLIRKQRGITNSSKISKYVLKDGMSEPPILTTDLIDTSINTNTKMSVDMSTKIMNKEFDDIRNTSIILDKLQGNVSHSETFSNPFISGTLAVPVLLIIAVLLALITKKSKY